jgi:signal transduction protein with GAF and PtsI domain
LRILLPMVTDVAEFNNARALVDRELERARLLGQPQPRQTLVGAMLEVPALVFMLPQILRRFRIDRFQRPLSIHLCGGPNQPASRAPL